ncbi:hypothetical protein [Salinispira pacifica]
MRNVTRWTVVLIVTLSATLPLFAQQQSQMGPDMGFRNPYQNQQPFTGQELSRWMRDWPDVTKWLDAHGDSVSQAENPSDIARFFRGADLTAYLRSKGWTPDRFGYVTVEVALCLAAVEMETQMPEANSQIEDSIKQIQDNPNMSAAQKQATIEQLRAVQSQMGGFSANVPKSELALVKPKQDELKKILDENS